MKMKSRAPSKKKKILVCRVDRRLNRWNIVVMQDVIFISVVNVISLFRQERLSVESVQGTVSVVIRL